MLRQYRNRFLLILLVFSIIFITFYTNNDESKQIQNEILQEENYIYQDAVLTTQLHLDKLYKQLMIKLDNIEEYNDIERLKEEYPDIINISLENNKNTQKIINKYQFSDNYAYLLIPKVKSSKIYKVKVKLSIMDEIEKKQQLRMFTVTHLQNNRWKTNPTKYTPNIALSIEKRLPDLEPSKDAKGISHYIENELVIKFKKEVDESYIQAFLEKYGLEIEKRRSHTVITKSNNIDIKTLIAILEDKKNTDNLKLEYVEPHFIYLTNNVTNSFIPNDVLYLEYQWNLPTILTERGWEKTRGNDEVIIAVVDTGIDLNHPEFKEKLVDGHNVIEPDKPPIDDDGHGTHVAGIISANTNNQEGIAGITWYNKIMPIKVLDQSGAGTLFDVAEGIYWATEHGAKVINLSLGNYAESRYLADAIKYAYSNDVVLVAAAGNDNIDELGFPAAYSEVIAVAAIDNLKARANFSNFGPYIDVVAPGINIASTYPDYEYAVMSGTSMASPHVAGLAGLIRAINPNLSNKEVVEIIKKTATDIGPPGKDQYFGYGVINIEKALSNSIQEPQPKDNFLQWLLKLFNLD